MPRKALIDADVLRYEVSSVGTNKDGEVMSFDFVKNIFDERIRLIKEGSESDEVHLFITDDPTTHKIAKRSGIDVPKEFIPNFRNQLALGKPYKGTRIQDKPFHWANLTAYILSGEWPNTIAYGCEADDIIGIEGYQNDNVIICTRDKDLRQVPGWHYGWECGKQAEFGPVKYDSVGKLDLIQSKPPKIRGGGFAFFASQLFTGDVVDNIGGLPNYGPVKAYNLLQSCTTEREYFSAVVGAYKESYGSEDGWISALREQCSLLWIIREREPDGSLKHFNLEEWIDG